VRCVSIQLAPVVYSRFSVPDPSYDASVMFICFLPLRGSPLLSRPVYSGRYKIGFSGKESWKEQREGRANGRSHGSIGKGRPIDRLTGWIGWGKKNFSREVGDSITWKHNACGGTWKHDSYIMIWCSCRGSGASRRINIWVREVIHVDEFLWIF